ncbi:hypothetical protein SAMN05444354_104178 [Stigmatella aurantiaca]|uniref:Uncharacterized protein n=1 Tax=Stigmatella aurantiaca TaxID=41 RepID=A0A1H7N0C4_STIAU|nr:ankyrin repeat domain-containing protein [Stigmatella aurantiaca]SEL17012.1 hypothetical protein SAMN05444354_104178 [Stigmatella aurantiaca]
MMRKMMMLLGAMALVMALGMALMTGYLFLWERPSPSRVLAMSDAERYLLAAARVGDSELVAGLVKAGTPVEVQDKRGFSPLILAAYHGHLDTVKVLLASGANACAGDSRGNTALMGAAFKGHADIVTLLLQQPCAVDQSNGLGQTALMFASLFGRKEVADALRQHGASGDRKDASGRSAQDWAATQTVEPPIPSAEPAAAAPGHQT